MVYGVDPDLTREGGSIPVTLTLQVSLFSLHNGLQLSVTNKNHYTRPGPKYSYIYRLSKNCFPFQQVQPSHSYCYQSMFFSGSNRKKCDAATNGRL